MIVYKFLLEEVEIVVEDIEWIIGCMGVVIFIVVMVFVWVVGIMVSWVSLYNVDFI